MVHSTDGFQWLNEGTTNSSKWGYVGNAPGASLVIRLDVRAYPELSLLIHYQQSWHEVGWARTECWQGCTCRPVKVDAYKDYRSTQTSHFSMEHIARAVDSDNCDLRITILNETSTAGHKFKVRTYRGRATPHQQFPNPR